MDPLDELKEITRRYFLSRSGAAIIGTVGLAMLLNDKALAFDKKDRFASAAGAPILLNLSIVATLLLAPLFSDAGHAAAWGVLLAGVAIVLLVGGDAEAHGIGKKDTRPQVGGVKGAPNGSVLVVERVGQGLRRDDQARVVDRQGRLAECRLEPEPAATVTG